MSAQRDAIQTVLGNDLPAADNFFSLAPTIVSHVDVRYEGLWYKYGPIG